MKLSIKNWIRNIFLLVIFVSVVLVIADTGNYSETSPFSCGTICNGGYELSGHTADYCSANPTECFNTIDDCMDGTAYSYEHVQDIIITNLNGSDFYGGHTIEIDAYLDCDLDCDEGSFVYYNGTSWKSFYDFTCFYDGLKHYYKNLTLDDAEGNHTVRITMAYAGTTGMICAYDEDGVYSDTDDVTFFVLLDTSDFEKPIVRDISPTQGQVYNYSQDLIINITVNVTDNNAISYVSANVSWGSKKQMFNLTNIAQDIYRLNFTNTSYLTRYNVNIFAYDSANNLNNTESTYFIVNTSTNISITYPVEDGLYNSGLTEIEFVVGSNMIVYSAWINVIDGINYSAEHKKIQFNDTSSSFFVNNSIFPNLSQSFFVDEDMSTDIVSLLIMRTGTPNLARIEIRNATNTDIILAYANITDVGLAQTWINYTLNQTINLNEGESYLLYLNGTGDSSNYYSWSANTDLFPKGNYTNDAFFDLLFKVYDKYSFNVSYNAEDDVVSYKAYANTDIGEISSSIITANYDYEEPSIYDTSVNPTEAIDLDPNVLINVTANVTDNLMVSEVIVFYQFANESEWHNKTMQNIGEKFKSNITVTDNNNVTIYFSASDTSGNSDSISSETYVVEYDLNWTVEPRQFNTTGVRIGENVTIKNLTIISYADYNYTFNLSAVSNRTIYFNDSQNHIFTLNAGKNLSYEVIALSADVPSTDQVNIRIDNLNLSANPSIRENNFTLVSYLGGPYLSVEIVEYISAVTQGDHVSSLKAKVWNVGNETANNIIGVWTLPSGWSSRDDLNASFSNLNSGGISYLEFEISADVSESATTGTQQISIYVNCTENSTDTDLRHVTVLAPSSQDSGSETTIITNSGSSAVIPSLPQYIAREDDFYTDLFELRVPRGEKFETSFILKNNKTNKAYNNISIEIQDLFSNYYMLNPSKISKFEIDKTQKIALTIALPEYFPEGNKDLNLIISLNNGEVIKKPFNIIVYDSQLNINECLNNSYNIIIGLNQSGINIENLYEQYLENLQSYNTNDYSKTRSFCNNIEILNKEYNEQYLAIELLIKSMQELKEQGYNVDEIKSYLLFLNEIFYQGNLEKTNEFLGQAQLYLETAKEINKPFSLKLKEFIDENKPVLISLIFFIPLISLISAKIVYLTKTENQIKRLKQEKEKIISLLKSAQDDFFNKHLFTQNLYESFIDDYRKRLGEIEVSLIKLSNKDLFKTKSEKNIIKQKTQIEGLLKKAHEDYYNYRIIDQISFEKIEEFYNKILSELDEEIEQVAPKKNDKKTHLKKEVMEVKEELKKESNVEEKLIKEPVEEIKEQKKIEVVNQVINPMVQQPVLQAIQQPIIEQVKQSEQLAEQLIEKEKLEIKINPNYTKKARAGNEFILENQVRIFTIEELHEYLHFMDEKLFSYHTNKDKNDFSSWINNVFNETQLAIRLHDKKSKEEFKKILDEYKNEN